MSGTLLPKRISEFSCFKQFNDIRDKLMRSVAKINPIMVLFFINFNNEDVFLFAMHTMLKFNKRTKTCFHLHTGRAFFTCNSNLVVIHILNTILYTKMQGILDP